MLRSHLVLISLIALIGVLAMAGERNSATDSVGSVLLVANKGDRSLGIVNPAEARQTATVPENDTTGHEVAASPDGHTAYVPIYGNSGVGKPGTDGRSMLVVESAGQLMSLTRAARSEVPRISTSQPTSRRPRSASVR